MSNLIHYGIVALIAASGTLIHIPPVDPTILFYQAYHHLDPFWCALAAALGNPFGFLPQYYLGRRGLESKFLERYERWRRFKGWVENFDTERFGAQGMMLIASSSFISVPPFIIVTLAGGMVGYSWLRFTIAAVIGRLSRYVLVLYSGHAVLAWLNA